MASVIAARRYAKGLLQLGKEAKSLDVLLADMQFIRSTFESSMSFHKMLQSPVIRDEKKLSIVLEVFKGKVSETTERLIEVLSEKSRIGLLFHISKAFETLYNVHAGILEISISTAFDLDAKQVDQLVNSMAKSTGKKIKASVIADKKLIGGVSIKYNDTVIDGSVRNKLEQMTSLLHV